MGALLLALIVIAAFGLLLLLLEGDDWSRMRHGHLPRPSMGAVGPWVRDVLPWTKADEEGKPEPLRQEAPAQHAPQQVAPPPQPPAAPVAPRPPERSVEESVYDRLYGGRRSVRREEERDD